MSELLQEAFRKFAHGDEMDGISFAVCMKSCGLRGDGLSSAEVNRLFSKYKPKTKRTIDYAVFVEILTVLAQKKGLEPDDIEMAIVDSPQTEQLKPVSTLVSRMATDRSFLHSGGTVPSGTGCC